MVRLRAAGPPAFLEPVRLRAAYPVRAFLEPGHLAFLEPVRLRAAFLREDTPPVRAFLEPVRLWVAMWALHWLLE